MAKTPSQLGSSTLGNVSAFDMASGRKRLSFGIGDLDDTGESLGLEFPGHNSADRGSPLKIGGIAFQNSEGQAVSAIGDRVNAWFSLNGQLGVIATREPATVYDAARQSIYATAHTFSHANSGVTIATAAANIRRKVLAVSAACYSFTSAGSLWLTDNVAAAYYIGRCTGVGQSWFLVNSPHVLYVTGTNTNLVGHYDGTALFMWSCTLYNAA